MPRIGLSLTLAALLAAATAFAQGPAAPLPGQVPGQPVGRVATPGAGVPGAGVPGGAPAGQPAPAAVDPKLMAHLVAWESTMKKASTFHSECSVVRKHLVRKTEKQSKGQVACQKPNLAFMRVDDVLPPNVPKNPNGYECYICNGKAIFEYDAAGKTVKEYPLPANGASGNLLLDFLSGAMTADAALKRFDIKVTKEEANNYYVHLELKPKFAEDKNDFEAMTVVLFGPGVPQGYVPYLPCVVIMRKPNGQEEERWEFTAPKLNVQLPPNYFTAQFPQGWKHEPQQRKPAPGAKPPAGPPAGGVPPLGPPR